METATSEIFSYDLIPLRLKLPEIRLLELFPAPNFNDDLRCRLYTVLLEKPAPYAGDGLPCSTCSVQDPLWYINLHRRYDRDACQGCGLTKDSRGAFETPSYRALSYAWGNGTKSHEIFTINPTEVGNHHHNISSAGRSTDGGGPAYVPEREVLSIPITASLDSCLRHLRTSYGSESLTIWIDQICIDQSNDHEKSAQVELMRKIYSLAHQVIVWLGPAADGSDDVMDAHARVALLSSEFHQEMPTGIQPTWQALRNFYAIEQNWSLPTFQRLVDNVVKIYAPLIGNRKIQKWLNRDWFSRIWVIQELTLSRDAVFVCGDRSLHARAQAFVSLDLFTWILWYWSLDDIYNTRLPEISTSILLLSKTTDLAELREACMAVLTAFDWQRPDLRLLDLYTYLYTNKDNPWTTSKYRDRLYGVLGLASDSDHLDIRPDYSTETKTTMVLTQIARALIEKGNERLQVLSMAQFPKQGITEMEDGVDEESPLPSWVPDWYNGLRFPYRYIHGHVLGSLSASADRSVQVVPTVLQSTLGLRGFLVDTIEEVGSYVPKRDTSAAPVYIPEIAADFYHPLCSVRQFWHRSKEKGPGIYSHVLRQNEALWRVPIGDLWYSSEGKEHTIRPPSDLGACFEQVLEYCRIEMLIKLQRLHFSTLGVEFVPILSQEEEHVIREAEDEQGVLMPYLERISYMLYWTELRPYLTTHGYLGLGPLHTQPGDILVIFSGGEVPFVIRPVTTDTDRYRFKPDAGNQGKSDDQTRVNSDTEIKQAVANCHDPNFKLPESSHYTQAEIHAMYEQHKLHQSSHPPPEPIPLPTRPNENDNIYTFVGEAFCDGIMDGEFMERAGEIQDFFLI